ncbi:MAG: orotidine-5'-phosphate decarboxylase [Saprospiraceae bacterium]|nr:orotidine-5'-phosphate decarboxylase [Saprospiraceae bacterium]
MKRETLVQNIFDKQSFLCVGLDTDVKRIPMFLRNADDPIFEFNKQIIDSTRDQCVAYKPNIAFYESLGPQGWISLEKTLNYIPDSHFTIADAKRGDIGNTSQMYARTFFERYDFDAVTVAPYMGIDSVLPFLEFEDKWVILLALTSNQGSHDFQLQKSIDERFLYEHVLETAQQWGNPDNLMFVVGATQATSLQQVRSIVPDHFLLVPGVGSQGGDLGAVYEYGKNDTVGLLVNSSRSIIYAGSDEHFGAAAANASTLLAKEMRILMAE